MKRDGRREGRPGGRAGGGGGRGDGLKGTGGLFELALSFAGTMLAGMAVGYYGGRWLDARWGTDPWLQLAGLLLGSVAGFRVIWRTLQRMSDTGGEEPAGPPGPPRAPGPPRDGPRAGGGRRDRAGKDGNGL